MRKILFILLILTNLYSNTEKKLPNPIVYAVLGDSIYNNVDMINELRNLKEFQVYLEEIEKYVNSVEETKIIGYKIEEGAKNISKADYLKKLRKLSKTNDFFVQNVKSNFKFALKNNDNKLFVSSVDSGLINIKRYEKKIKKYYFAHEDEIEEYGNILSMIVNGHKRVQITKEVYRAPTKAEIQYSKMKRIREKDKAKQEALHRSLEEELIHKKANIRKVQKEELKSTSR